nr:AraC-type transcriptional regulator N-terminus [uncultured organism]
MDLRKELATRIDRATASEGLQPTALPGVKFIKALTATECTENNWKSSFAIVAQGEKEVSIANSVHITKHAHYVANLVDLAVTSRMTKAPYLALLIELDAAVMVDVARQIHFEETDEVELLTHGLFMGPADDRMFECALRIVKSMDDPDDTAVLGPLAIRELYYLLLKSPQGPAIRQFVSSGSRFHRIAEAIHYWRSDLSLKIEMADLAKKVGMSRTQFFRAFKEVTSMSPIQYQKRLRLIEARQLLTNEDSAADEIAFKVGYKSVPQFSREYSRFFGNPPKRDALIERAKLQG